MQAFTAIKVGASPASPSVSCLCVTERREPFLPWLLWNYQKQDYQVRELVVVDGSERAGPSPWPPAITLVRCEPGTSVARKRNLAVDAARGELVAWFDDDDWQHPRRLSLLVAALAGGADVAGPTQSWFVDLARDRARAHASQRSVIFNGLAVRRAALERVRFDERRARAADSAWLAAVRREARCGAAVVPHVLSFWLCHRDNLSNPAQRYVFPHPLAAVRGAVGAEDWGNTDAQLGRLRERLGAA